MLKLKGMSVTRTFALARIEFDSYLRNGFTVFWTGIYPVFLFCLLWMIFSPSEDSNLTAQLEVSGSQSDVSRFETRLDSVVEGISGVDVELAHADADEGLRRSTVRVVLTEDGNYQLQAEAITSSASWASYMLAIAALECYNAEAACATERTTQSLGEGSSLSAYARYLTIGIATLSIMTVALFGFSATLIGMRAGLQLRMIQILPMESWEFLVAFALSRLAILVAFSMLFIYTMNWWFGAGISLAPLHVLINALLIFFGGLAFLSVAFVIATVIENPGVAGAFSNILNFLLMMLSDLFLPIALMPSWLQSIIHYTPVYMFVTAMREVVGSSQIPPAGDLMQIFASLILVAVIALTIANKRFRWSLY